MKRDYPSIIPPRDWKYWVTACLLGMMTVFLTYVLIKVS
jgi:hypothetical protein